MTTGIQAVKPAKHRPALRLVKTTDLSRNEWLDVRKKGIGSSDASAAVGLNPYKSSLELWLEKTGRDEHLPKLDPTDDTTPAFFGNLLEPIVASLYTSRTGNRVRKTNAVLQHPDPSLPWVLANIDREVLGDPAVSVLECKTTGINGSRLWKDGVPEYVVLQVQHQLAVTGKQAADVAVLVFGQELRVHRVDRDEGLIANLMELERRFWTFVETDTPPPADGSDSASTALQALFPQDSGNTVDFSLDTGMSAAFADLVTVRELIAEKGKLEAQLKQRLQQAMGEASRAVFETGEVTWKRSKDGLALNVEALLKDQPELMQRYPLVKPGSRRFIFV